MEEKIKIVENGICIDIEKLKKIIINKWQSGRFYRDEYNRGYRGELLHHFILSELEDHADGLFYETEKNAQKNLAKPNARLDWFDKYPRSDIRSIGFEVLEKLRSSGSTIELTTDDIPAILEFLNTPPDKALEAWNKWEKYWAGLDYPERRRKLLESANTSMAQIMQKWVNIVDTGIGVDIEQLKKIVIDEWQSGELCRFYYNQRHRGDVLQNRILVDLRILAETIEEEIYEEAVRRSGDLETGVDWNDKYPRSDIRSIGFEVLQKLLSVPWNCNFSKG